MTSPAFPVTMPGRLALERAAGVLAEVVSGAVKVQTRELADVESFMHDTERIVLGKAASCT